MDPHRPQSLLAIVAIATVAAIVAVVGCSDTPLDGSDFGNPFDPDNPNYDPDPFDVTAVYDGSTVTVGWTRLDFQGFVRYEILRSLQPDSGYEVIGSNNPNALSYSDNGFAPGTTNYYKLRIVDAGGNASPFDGVAPASVMTGAFISIADGADQTNTRYVDVTIRAYSGATAELSNDSTFATSSQYTLEPNVDLVVEDWDLGTASAPGETLRVYTRIDVGGGSFLTNDAHTLSANAPTLSIVGGNSNIDTTEIRIAVEAAEGVLEMRTAASEELLSGASWQAVTDTFDWTMQTGCPVPERDQCCSAQDIFAEFSFDFGYSAIQQTAAVPQGLTGVNLLLQSSNGGDGADTTTSATIVVVPIATGADSFKYIEVFADGDTTLIADLPWKPIVAGSPHTLAIADTTSQGIKTVLAHFKNLFCFTTRAKSIVYSPPPTKQGHRSN